MLRFFLVSEKLFRCWLLFDSGESGERKGNVGEKFISV